MTAPAKLFGVIEVPPKSTHCMIHTCTETGAIGPPLRIEFQEGKWADLFPLADVSNDWLMMWAPPGPYRVGFYFVDATGKKIRVAPVGGAVDVQPSPAKKLKKKGSGTPGDEEDGRIDGLGLFQLLREMQRDARADADARASQQLERDRAFYTMLQSQQNAFVTQFHQSRADDEEDDDDDDADASPEDRAANAVVKVLKEAGEQAKPFLKKFGAKLAEKAAEGE